MTKNKYLITGCISLLAATLLVVLELSWPLYEYSINDLITGNVILSPENKYKLIHIIGFNYALDNLFLFTSIGAWIGLLLHFEAQKKFKSVAIFAFSLSLIGAILDFLENAIIFGLLKNTENVANINKLLFTHSVIREISYWLPMIASFIIVLILPKSNKFSHILLLLSGSLGTLVACLGMYIPILGKAPNYWFGIWFLTTGIFLLAQMKTFKKLP